MINNSNFIVDLNREKSIVSIDIQNFEYNEEIFEEFLILFNINFPANVRDATLSHKRISCINFKFMFRNSNKM